MIYNRRIRQLCGTAADFAVASPLLLAGEKAIESDTLREKVGDGETLYNDLLYLDDVQRGYKVYTALLSQTGTNDPTVLVLKNTLGGEIVWVRDGIGTYTGTLSNFTFPPEKTFVPPVLVPNTDVVRNVIIFAAGENVIISSGIADDFADINSVRVPIEIRVYN